MSDTYDSTKHENQIVAMYETDAQAHAAQALLTKSGVPSAATQVIDRSTGHSAGTVGDQGFWGSVRSLFAPDEDISAYGHALDRGHAMLVVHLDGGMDRANVIHLLEGTDPVDFDTKLDQWREAGYDYSSHPMTGTAVGAADGMAMSAPVLTAPVAYTETASPMADVTTPSPFAEPARDAPRQNTAAPDTIKVIEERLRVGKREVANGAVRVRSYVVERPVEEQVRLHEERITLERRPVDRPATEADLGAFQERTIEARATAEEAVVSKTAHVVEEIDLRKDVADRTETVRDTVRRTEVEVEETPKPHVPGV